MIPGDLAQWVALSWLFAFGAVVGSFLNVCIYRFAQHERLWDQLSSLTYPPSSCPFCHQRILAIDNIPVIGWLVLRGRCRFCRHWIPPRYPLIEFLNGMLWVLLYVAIVPAGFTAMATDSCLWSPLSALANPALSNGQVVFQLNAMYFYYLVLVEALLVATIIDFDLQIIPDGATIPALVVGVLAATVIGDLHVWPVWFQSPPARLPWMFNHPHLHGLAGSVAGLVIGGGVIWVLRIVGEWAWKREVMGFGDVVLMMLIGSFLGWQPTLMVFFVAPFCALIATVLSLRVFKSREIAYGPYLSAAAVIVLIAWKPYFSHRTFCFELGSLIFILGLVLVVLMATSLVLMRQIRRLLGFRDFDFEDLDELWTSGDQLAFFPTRDDDTNQRSESEQRETGHRNLRSRNWPGQAAGQGRLYVDRWRSGGR